MRCNAGDGDRKQHILFKPPNTCWGPPCGTESPITRVLCSYVSFSHFFSLFFFTSPSPSLLSWIFFPFSPLLVDEEMDMAADDDVRVGGSRAITKVVVSENDKYLVPWETEAQLKLLWRFNSPILDFIWGRALMGTMGGKLPRLKTGDINDPNVNDGWKMFFSRVVIVPPNRFRPASKMGDATSEHPQVPLPAFMSYQCCDVMCARRNFRNWWNNFTVP